MLSRPLSVAASLLVLVVACSSSTDGEECPVVGTYSMTGEIETTTCKFPAGSDTPSATTVQLATAPEGSGADFTWSAQGITGQCPLKRNGTCKLEGRCPLRLTDATTANDQAEILVSWTFDAKGFSGITSLTAPPFKDNPDGCVQTAKNTATRR